MRDFAFVFAVAAMMFGALPAHGVEPDEILPDAALEMRARNLSSQLRCLVCQNQSIDDSNAPLAKDLRVLVRDRLKAGDDDEAVMDFVVQRYGDFVLLKPPFNLSTMLLWLSPLLVLAGALTFVLRSAQGNGMHDAATPQALSEDEKKKLQDIIGHQSSDRSA